MTRKTCLFCAKSSRKHCAFIRWLLYFRAQPWPRIFYEGAHPKRQYCDHSNLCAAPTSPAMAGSGRVYTRAVCWSQITWTLRVTVLRGRTMYLYRVEFCDEYSDHHFGQPTQIIPFQSCFRAQSNTGNDINPALGGGRLAHHWKNRLRAQSPA